MSAKTESFIKKLAPLAQAEYKKREKWVLPSVCIAQAALETGWGQSKLMTKANAFFGIKANTTWKGKVYNAATSECYDGINYTNITACFRAYDSLEESVKDYYDLITGLSRYKKAVCEPDPHKAITAIKNGGYATSPTYVKNVLAIINTYNLTIYDKQEETLKPLNVLIEEVISGKWGNGEARKQLLTNAGYSYALVQKAVNKKMQEDAQIEAVAKQVISGKWGNGVERKNRLKKAGYDYSVIQSKVNELLKNK